MGNRTRWGSWGALLTMLLLVASAEGQEQQRATVNVTLRTASGEVAEGRVTLQTLSGAEVASCTTELGKCTLEQVEGGSYLATVKPAKGPSPKPRKVMIPPSGEVGLVLSTGT